MKIQSFLKKMLIICTSSIISLILITFLSPMFTYADIIKVSEDVNPSYKKDFNGDGKFVVILDPGHGGKGNFANRGIGFFSNSKDEIIYEDEIDLKLAKLIRDNIKSDGRIEVYMTREDDVEVSLVDRGVKAKNFSADLMISIHFNNSPSFNQSPKSMGCEIWQSVIDMYKPYGLAKMILAEFNKNHLLQITRGLKERVSEDTYWDYNLNDAITTNTGFPADYYGVIKAGARNMVPTIIVEHAFFSNDYDFANMQNEDFYEELAKRESKAIIDWFFN